MSKLKFLLTLRVWGAFCALLSVTLSIYFIKTSGMATPEMQSHLHFVIPTILIPLLSYWEIGAQSEVGYNWISTTMRGGAFGGIVFVFYTLIMYKMFIAV